MKAIAAYMASRSTSREGGSERRNNYPESRNEPGRREYENRRSEYEGAENRVYSADLERQPNQYPARHAMGEDWPEGNEMRRRRDSGGRYMNDYQGGAESRYRGRDGRWKAGTRRNEQEGGAYGNDPMDRRMGDDEDDEEEEAKEYGVTVKPQNVIQWPYMPGMPHMPPESRMIGFGNRQREYETRGHYGKERENEKHIDGRAWREHKGDVPEINRETAEAWANSMRNEDPAKPAGPRWSMEELKPMAQKMGITPDPNNEEFLEFWVMTNAMYSDYCEVAKKSGVTNPEFYGMMAKAWMRDKDAMPNKTALYYECCVKK